MGEGEPSLIFAVLMGDLFSTGRPRAHIDRVVTTIALSKHIGLLPTKFARQMADYFAVPRSEKTLRLWKEKLWLGFSAERQKEFNHRWRAMRPLAASGWTVFVSLAPLLEPVTLPDDLLALGDRAWVIVGGEQHPGKRPMNPDWARAALAQCRPAGVPYFLYQMAARKRIPHDLFVRQFPRH
jgi:protein gp37